MSEAHGDTHEMESTLPGTWRMTRWTRRLVATGEESDAFGPDPKGFMSYDLAGRLMVIVVRGSRIRPESSLPTDAEKLALFDSMFAYAGTYRVEPDRIVHELDTSWNELWSGSRQTRFYSWDGKRLVYTSPPTVDPLDGQECVYTITWEKIGRERS